MNEITLEARVRANSSLFETTKGNFEESPPNRDLSMSILDMPKEERRGEISNILEKYFVSDEG